MLMDIMIDGNCSLKEVGHKLNAVFILVQQVENSDHLLLMICAVRAGGKAWCTAQGLPDHTLCFMQKLQNL